MAYLHPLDTYRNLKELLEDAQKASEAIRNKPPKPKKPRKPSVRKGTIRSPFILQVLEVAERHRTMKGGRYNVNAITLEILGKARQQVDNEEFRQTKSKIASALIRLKQSGKIAPTTPWRSPRFRQVTDKEIQRHTGLVHFVLRRGHKFLRRNWRGYLTYPEAAEIGTQGLIDAIETFDKNRGVNFATHALNRIAGRIARAVKKRSRAREVSMDASQRAEDKRTLHDKLGKAAPDVEILEHDAKRLLQHHQRGKLTKRELQLWTLRRFGHTLQEVGDHFGFSRERARQLEEKAKEKLKLTYSSPTRT